MPRTPPQPYTVKFAEYIRMLAQAKEQGAEAVLIHNPQTLGETYAELVESLNRLAVVGLALRIVPPAERRQPGRRRS